jgi:hypothetical protein
MIIHNPILTGSFTVNGTDVASITSSAASITAINSYTASQNILNGTYATTGSNTFAGIQTVNSNLVVTGSITAQTLVVQTVSSSVIYSSGSNVFGNNIANTQVMTGSLLVTGSSTFSGSVSLNGTLTAGLANGNIRLKGSTDGFLGVGESDGKLYLADWNTAAKGLVINMANGNVGIGTTSPSASLDIYTGSIGTYFRGGSDNIARQLKISSATTTNAGDTHIIDAQSGTGNLVFSTTSTERMRITSDAKIKFTFASDRGIRMSGTQSTESNLASYQSFTENIRELRIVGSTLYFNTGDGSNSTGTERMNITEAGVVQFGSSSSRRNALQQSNFGYSNSYKTLLIGSTGTDYSTNAVTLCFGVDVSANANGSFSGNGTEYIWRNAGSFKSPNSANDNYNTLLSWNSSGIVTVTTSDYRAKEDLKSFEALPMIEAMKLYDFRWIELQERMHGVLAHELQDIVPYAVIGEKDGGSMQGVDYSKLVPVMLKAIQELQAQITELKNK